MSLNEPIAALLEKLMHPALPTVDLSLERLWKLLDALGDPQERLPPVVHIAGTNGKGSTLAFLQAIYETAGYRVHRYTSPHLVRFNERILLAGNEITDAQLLPLLEHVAHTSEKIPVTFFEATTAVAFLAFAERMADVVLLETGLGGRLDATNVIAHPLITAITPIGLDHQEFLGNSLAAIAGEKAGIMKAGTPCVLGAQPEEAFETISRIAAQRRAPLIAHGQDWRYESSAQAIHVTYGDAAWELPLPPLAGAHQHHNAAMASVIARACAALPVHPNAIPKGIGKAIWPGRLQTLASGPLVEAWGARGAVILDGGHNVHAANALAVWLREQHLPVTMICGMMARKDAAAFFAPLATLVHRLITVPITGEACYPPAELANAAQAAGIPNAEAADSLAAAMTMLTEAGPGILLIAGSLFLAGEVLKNHG